ncbi:MAG: C40 family peptidase [Clostridiales bacterium]|nr:C40 family peptidase [Clostridiales bacterium]
MDSLFLKVLEMSVTGSIVILITMLARFLLRKRSKRFIMILWAVVAIRLLVPVSIESSLSFFNYIPWKTQTLTATSQVQDAAVPDSSADTQRVTADHAAMTGQQDIIVAETDVNMGNESLSADLISADPLPDIKTVLSTVWLIGALGITVFCSVQYVILKRKLRNAKNIGGNVYESDKISTPFVFGFFVPGIYLPDFLEKPEKEYVLLHERTHIRHGDWLTKIIGVFAVAVHWFNPLVWLAYMLFEQDIEMSCDESVVAGMDAYLKQVYTMSIVSFAKQSNSKRYLVTPLGFSKVNFSKTEVTNRVKNIINFKKGKTATAVVITAVLLFVGAGCTLNSKTGDIYPNSVNEPEAEVTETSVTETEVTVATETEETEELTEGYEGGRLWNLEVDGPKGFAIFVKDQIGTPYAAGGDFPDKGFDEVGFVAYCYKYYLSLGMGATAEEICAGFDGSYDSVPVNNIHVGDVVVYDSGNVAIYVGNGEVVYASAADGCVCSGELKMENIRAIKHFVDYSNSNIGLG